MRAYLAFTVSLSCLLGGCMMSKENGDDVSANCAVAESGREKLECEVFEIVNRTRRAGASCGGQRMDPVPALELNSILVRSARAHADDMAARGYFDHDSPEGTSPFDRMQAAGYELGAGGENIAAGSPTAEGTMDQWMQSTGHCRNIMGGQYVHIGVGYAKASGELDHLWVQNFGSPL
jgi:uncharacterized protein YkwD